jgi:hypothetical protein
MPVEPPSFLSYSRKDYYFAESLAFHLLGGIFARDYNIGWVATAVVVGLCAYTMATQGGAIGRVLLVVAFLVSAYVWLSWQREDLAFWFPQEPAGARSRSRTWRRAGAGAH